ncbi:MAG: hypothetical protein ABWK53_02865 [Anaerolineales bacterium]
MPEVIRTWIVFVVGLVMLSLGWLIGFLDSNLRANKKIRAAELKAEVEIEAARQKAAQEQQAAAPPALLRLWSSPDQQLHLEIDGNELETPQSLAPEQRRRLIAILGQVRPWVEGKPLPAAPRPAPPAGPPTPAAPPAVEPVKASLFPGRAKPVEPAPAPLSIVEQINEVLQKRLAGTPLGMKAISLSESPTGGVIVRVGAARYQSIDAVPDPEVVAAIRAAIAEWETRPQ